MEGHELTPLSELVAGQRKRIEAIMARPPWTCSKCGTTYRFPEDRIPECWDCAQAASKLAARLDALAVPVKFAGLGIEVPKLQAWVERVVAGTETDGFLLSGPTDVHKTGNAFAALHAAVTAGFGGTVRWVSVPELFGGPPHNEQREIVTALCRAGLVFLDDVGAAAGGTDESTWVAAGVGRILNARWQDERPTLVTTNLNPEGTEKGSIAHALGERIASRLSSFHHVQLVSASRDRRRRTGTR